MAERDAAGIPDGRGQFEVMGWEQLPYGCAGLVRKTDLAGGKAAWSWLILVPWAVNDAKPWIDGTKLLTGRPLPSEADQRDQVLAHMRSILDKRYGESVANRAVENFVEEISE